MRTLRIVGVVTLGLIMGLAGCKGNNASDTKKAKTLEGVTLTLVVPEGTPLADAFKFRVNEFSSRTKAQVDIVSKGIGDIRVRNGVDLASAADAQAFSSTLIKDPSLKLDDLPALFRNVFCVRNGEVLAIPLCVEIPYVWYRGDWFADPAVIEAYRAKTGKKLAAPATWDDYLTIARFFQGQAPGRFGAVEPTNESDAFLRGIWARAASFSTREVDIIGPFDPETGASTLASPIVQRAIENWAACVATGPKPNEPLTPEKVVETFLAGQTAMMISSVPPTANLPKDKRPSWMDKVRVANLPTADAKTQRPHLGHTGWYLTLSRTINREAAEKLVAFLAAEEDIYYLASGARRGLLPAHDSLLRQPTRFSANGLPAETCAAWFDLTLENLRPDRWLADLRVAVAPSLRTPVYAGAKAVLGGAKPSDAMAAPHEKLETFLSPHRKAYVSEYRASLGLPRLIGD